MTLAPTRSPAPRSLRSLAALSRLTASASRLTAPASRLTAPASRLTAPAIVVLFFITSFFIAAQASAFPQALLDWQDRYGAISASGDAAECQLCHANASGGSPWNAYGWSLLEALADPGCDDNGDGTISNAEALYCIETENSDLDGSGYDNLFEIGVGTQPGWTNGPNNTLYTRAGEVFGQLPPSDIGPLDPDGTEPPPPVVPPPPGDDEPLGPPRLIQVVWPGQSIQTAIDRARPGGYVLVLPGTYRELGDRTNALNIHKSVHLIGLSTKRRPVVLENAGNQRNGIVAVPEDRQDCLGCHTSLAPPFPLQDGVEPGLKMREPMIRNLSIHGVTISNFTNNGLFTENVDGFKIVDVESVGNKNYGIFPTLSRNGLIVGSRATGADDSGIWVETSENVRVIGNLAEGNTNGFEVSNSDDIELIGNVARHNTAGFAILLLPDIFDDRPGAKRIDMRHNWIYENNKLNTARPGSILATLPPGIGALYLGVDDSEITDNYVWGNDFTGIAIADYCLTVDGTPFSCEADPSVTPEYVADNTATNNRVARNVLVDNGQNADPATNPFFFAASDLTLLTLGEWGNCYEENSFATLFSTLGVLPPCP